MDRSSEENPMSPPEQAMEQSNSPPAEERAAQESQPMEQVVGASVTSNADNDSNCQTWVIFYSIFKMKHLLPCQPISLINYNFINTTETLVFEKYFHFRL